MDTGVQDVHTSAGKLSTGLHAGGSWRRPR
jgi:hypothetical protein